MVVNFINLSLTHPFIEGDNASSEVTQPLQKNGVYQISDKLTPHKDNSFNIVITTSIRLHLVEDYILISNQSHA